MNVRTFGTDDKQDAFFDRYGVSSYEEAGKLITDVQRQVGVSTQRLTSIEGVTREPSHVFVDRATDKAIKFLADLWMERSTKATRDQVVAWAQSVDRTVVSDKIEWLKAQPKLQQVPASAGRSLERHNVPAGRYAVDGNEGQTVFVKVDIPTEGRWAGRIFVKVQASDELHRTSRDVADALLGKIAAAGVQESMLRYGREIGSCGHCGRTLTNEESREYGIGPKCRSNMGW